MTKKNQCKSIVAELQERGYDIGILSDASGICFTDKDRSTIFSDRFNKPSEAFVWLHGYQTGFRKRGDHDAKMKE